MEVVADGDAFGTQAVGLLGFVMAGAAGCAEHGGDAAVAGDFSGGDAQDEGVDLVVEGGWGHEGLAYQIEVLLM